MGEIAPGKITMSRSGNTGKTDCSIFFFIDFFSS
jgi:hypothetical protein